MPKIRLTGHRHPPHARGAVLTCTDDVAACRASLDLITHDRAHALVSGGHAEWVDAPDGAASDLIGRGGGESDGSVDDGGGHAGACGDDPLD